MTLIGRVAAAAAAILLVGASVTAWPPGVAPDGGWRAAESDATAIEAATGGAPYALVGLPELKSLNAIRFPLERLGVDPPGPEILGTPAEPGLVVVVCDPLFEELNGGPCGGPAEDAWLRSRGLDLVRQSVTHDAPRRVISYYGSAGGR